MKITKKPLHTNSVTITQDNIPVDVYDAEFNRLIEELRCTNSREILLGNNLKIEISANFCRITRRRSGDFRNPITIDVTEMSDLADSIERVISSGVEETFPPVAASTPSVTGGAASTIEKKSDNINTTALSSIVSDRNIILQGPPGTSKTWLAKKMAAVLIREGFSSLEELINNAENASDECDEGDQIKIVQFHPSLTYEDFVRGLVSNGNGGYESKNKVFAQICEDAKDNENKNYVLIIDEINRANLPAVFGELIYALEYRDKPVETPYQVPKSKPEDFKLMVPSNLFIIGSMNTADRSIGQMDYALRRRFVFIDQLPEPERITDEEAKKSYKQILELFVASAEPIDWSNRNNESLSADFRPQDVAIGHTYFIKEDWKFQLRYKVVPVLEEYLKDGVLLDPGNKLLMAIQNAKNAAKSAENPDDSFTKSFSAADVRYIPQQS